MLEQVRATRPVPTGIPFAVVLVLLLGSPVLAAEEDTAISGGAICIAPFKPVEGPTERMLQGFPAPTKGTRYAFRVAGKPERTVPPGEMVLLTGISTDSKTLVEVRVDDRPLEAFWLDLAEAPANRICLWLYPGYWHWIDNGWKPSLGCKCKVEPPAG